MDKTQEQIWEMIQEMNRKWTVENNADKLKNYFHKDMAAIPTSPKHYTISNKSAIDTPIMV